MKNDLVKPIVRSSFFRYCLAACHRIQNIQEKQDDLYETISAQCKHCGSDLSLMRAFANSYRMRMGGAGSDSVCLRMTKPGELTCTTPQYFDIPWSEPDLQLFFCPKFRVFQ